MNKHFGKILMAVGGSLVLAQPSTAANPQRTVEVVKIIVEVEITNPDLLCKKAAGVLAKAKNVDDILPWLSSPRKCLEVVLEAPVPKTAGYTLHQVSSTEPEKVQVTRGK